MHGYLDQQSRLLGGVDIANRFGTGDDERLARSSPQHRACAGIAGERGEFFAAELRAAFRSVR